MTKPVTTAVLELLLWIQYCHGKASFTKAPPSPTYAVQGQTVRLLWEYQVDDRDTEFEVNSPRWDYYDNDGRVHPIASEDSNYSWQWTLHKDTCPERLVNRVSKESMATLVIANVTMDDNGTYGCSLVLQMASAITKKVKLVVTTIPYFTPKPPFIKSVNESDDLNISCSAHGFPKPNVTWVRKAGNKNIVMSEGRGVVSLYLPNITRNYSGTYKCQAINNPNESPVEALTQIIVIFSADFSYLPPKNNLVIEGMYLELNCSADSLSQNVTWFHLHKGSKVLKSHGIGGATLRFPRITRKDNGTYECRALSDIIGDTGISAYTEVIVMCDCNTLPTETKSIPIPTKGLTDTMQNGTRGELEGNGMAQNILNSKTFMISLLTATCISVLVNIVLIIYICLKIHRNRYEVSENVKEIVRFGPPNGKGNTVNTEEATPIRSINNAGIVESIALKPVNAVYERIPDPAESPSPKEPHPYATPIECMSPDPSPKARQSKEIKQQSPPGSRLHHHYQDLDDFTLVFNQQEYQSLDRSEAVSNPHPKHGPVGTPWKYETLTLTKKQKPSDYQKLHVYSNVKDTNSTDGDKQSQKSTFK